MNGIARPAAILAGLSAAVLLIGLAVVAGSPGGVLPGASSSAGAEPPTSPVEGVVIAVDAVSLTEVRSFTLRVDDGATWVFRLGRLEDPTAFPPSHLSEHQATSVPVRVFFAVDGQDLVAYRLEDAG